MENQLYELDSCEMLDALCREEQQRIKSNWGMLKKSLTKGERRLLLHIVDDYENILTKEKEFSYITGFKNASQIMLDNLFFN